MGGAFSTEAGSSTKNSRVIAFHSHQKWKQHLEDSKRSDKLMVVDFSASWCEPSKFMEPIVNEFATNLTDVEFVKIDVDELASVAKEFGIQAVPTFVFIKNGKEVGKLVGADKKELEGMINKHRL